MAKPTQQEIESIRSANLDREIVEISLGEDVFLATTPSYPQWRRFMKERMDDAKKSTALVTLAQDCLLWPTREAWGAMLNRRPMLGEVIGGKIVEACGGDAEAQLKKL